MNRNNHKLNETGFRKLKKKNNNNKLTTQYIKREKQESIETINTSLSAVSRPPIRCNASLLSNVVVVFVVAVVDVDFELISCFVVVARSLSLVSSTTV